MSAERTKQLKKAGKLELDQPDAIAEGAEEEMQGDSSEGSSGMSSPISSLQEVLSCWIAPNGHLSDFSATISVSSYAASLCHFHTVPCHASCESKMVFIMAKFSTSRSPAPAATGAELGHTFKACIVCGLHVNLLLPTCNANTCISR